MAQNYKIRNMLKNLPFYSEEIKKLKEKGTTKKNYLYLPNITITLFILKK